MEDAYLNKYFGSITKSLAVVGAEGVLLTPDAGITLTQNLTEEGYQGAFDVLATVQKKNRQITTMVDRFIGQLICQYVATRDTSIEEAVSQLSLEERTGKAMKTLAKLPRMVSVLPNEAFALPNLSTMHYEAVTSFGGPKDNAEHMAEFNQDRMNLLRQISENPNPWSKAKVGMAMRDIQAKFAVPRTRGMPLSEILEFFTSVSVMLVEWEDNEFEDFGVSREETEAKWSQYREMLTAKGYLNENVAPPWLTAHEEHVDEPGNIIEAQEAEMVQGEVAVMADQPFTAVDLDPQRQDWGGEERNPTETNPMVGGFGEGEEQEAEDEPVARMTDEME